MKKIKRNQSNFRLDRELLKDTKKISIKTGKTITQIITEALECYMSRQENTKNGN